MTEFLINFFAAALSVILVGLLANWIARYLTLVSARHIAFAFALGLGLGRAQTAIEFQALSDLKDQGSALGTMAALGVLWFYWFKASPEKVNG